MTPPAIAFPTDLTAMLTLIASQAFIAIVISWVVAHLAFIQNPDRPNWAKVLLIALFCFAWALFSITYTSKALPTGPEGVYAVIYLTLVVLFDNQAFYGLLQRLPGWGDFIQALFGKTGTVTVSTTTNSTDAATLPAKTTSTTVSAEVSPALSADTAKGG